MSSVVADWVRHLDQWAQHGSTHRRRLHRAFWSAEASLSGDSERLLHSYSRLGGWAHELALAASEGKVSVAEISEQLEWVAQFGEFALERWGNRTGDFQNILHNELIPAFCSDVRRNIRAEGFRGESTLSLADVDRRDFVRAWTGGLVEHTGRGLYRASKSAANEQFFWSGPRDQTPRTFTLWHEPVITVAALARLHYDYGWPSDLIGTQSSDWAFDVVAFHRDSRGEHIAGEVKKTMGEAQQLQEYMREYGEALETAQPTAGRRRNAYKKVAALRARRAPIFWLVGPGGYNRVFTVQYRNSGGVLLEPAGEQALKFGSS